MAVLAIAIVFSLLLCGLAVRANRRFRREARLPMQWGLGGAVIWSAPRGIALGFLPALAVCLFAAYALLAFWVPPRAGQEALVLPVAAGIGGLFLLIQQVHFRGIATTLRRHGG